MNKFIVSVLSFFGILFSGLAYAEGMDPQQYAQWWENFKTTSEVPEDLKEMEDYFVTSELIHRCSKYWLFLNKMNIEQICAYGYLNFKQTVACNYFTWVVDRFHDYGKNLYTRDMSFLNSIPPSELSKKHDFFTQEQSLEYNRTTALFYDYLMNKGAAPYLDMLDEPFFGNPPAMTINNRAVSQDVLNSLLEYLSIASHCDMSQVATVLEVGGGSGRTAYCFLKIMPSIKYILVDIPPALYLAQTYLCEVFSDRQIFRFRPFDRFEDIQEEFKAADIVFMTADQIKKLPKKSVDLFMAIDCLHEMKTQEVKFYFSEADRLSSLFYFKCWNHTVVPFDQISHHIRSYPIYNHWKKVFEAGCEIPSGFFHACYKIMPPPRQQRLSR